MRRRRRQAPSVVGLWAGMAWILGSSLAVGALRISNGVVALRRCVGRAAFRPTGAVYMKAPKSQSTGIKKVCATNKYARSSYEIGKKFEAGISLVGTEVGPIVGGMCQMQDSYCRVKNGELWIYNLAVSKHKTTGPYFQHEEKRPKRLLMHKKEILELKFATERTGQTIVPLRVYINGDHKIKVEIAVCKGLKKYDKKETIKKRDIDRSIQQIMKSY